MSGEHEHQFNIVPLLVGTIVLVAIIIALAVVLGNQARRVDDKDEIIARIKPVAEEVKAVEGAGNVGARTGEQIVQSACVACHGASASPALGAPRIGDNAAWSSRIGRGLNGLLKASIAGKNAMPPRGGSDATDAELARAIAYMANKSGANFTPPK